MAGEDALIEATEGLRDGFSVGAQINEWTNNKGVMQITSATLDEVSLVTDPAIDSARVSEVMLHPRMKHQKKILLQQPLMQKPQPKENKCQTLPLLLLP
jgi:phage head maturation protease